MLTDVDCRSAQCLPEKARLRLSDSGNLYPQVEPNGSRRWFWKYTAGGKEKRISLGHYIETGCSKVQTSLKAAREARDAARSLHRTGVDPTQKKQLDKLANQTSADVTFEAVARDLHATKSDAWGLRYFERWIERMEKNLFPWIGGLPLPQISAPLLLQKLRRNESRGANETAHTLRQTSGQVFRYGVASGRCERNPAADLHGALRPIIVKHMPAVLEPTGVGALMRSIAEYGGQPLTRAALELSAMLFQRPGNIRHMGWRKIDLEGKLWTIPAAKMKRTVRGKLSGRPHFVPLTPRAVQILREVHPMTGHGEYVFPSLLTGERPMSENTIRTARRRMGHTNDDMTPHGFRAMVRTMLVEYLNIHPDVIEAQLAHGKSGPLGAAYDRAEFMSQRRRMMDDWSMYLLHLQRGGKGLPAKSKRKKSAQVISAAAA